MKEEEKRCGNCALFTDEDIFGDGVCEFHQKVKGYDYLCDDHIDKGNNDTNNHNTKKK